MSNTKARILLCLLSSFSLWFLSCGDSDSLNPFTTSERGIPVIANVQNSYAYVLVAKNYSETRTDILSFDTDSLIVALTVSGYTAGSGKIQIMDSANSVFFSEALDGNKVIAQKGLLGNVPRKASIESSEFSGIITFALTGKKD